jgi:hypothetical protein
VSVCYRCEKVCLLIGGLSGLEHSATPEEIDDVEKFLNSSIPPLGDKASS